jgi:hypothetical protein
MKLGIRKLSKTILTKERKERITMKYTKRHVENYALSPNQWSTIGNTIDAFKGHGVIKELSKYFSHGAIKFLLQEIKYVNRYENFIFHAGMTNAIYEVANCFRV